MTKVAKQKRQKLAPMKMINKPKPKNPMVAKPGKANFKKS